MGIEATYKIEFFQRKRRRDQHLTYYFRIVEENGQAVTQSQGYSRKVDRDTTAYHLRANLIEAEIIDAAS